MNRFGLVLAACVILFPAPAAWAQEEAKKDPEKAPSLAAVDFKGGSLQAYVQALQAASKGEPLNIIVSPGCEGATLPAISLRTVAAESAVGLLEHLDLPDFKFSVSTTPRAGASPVFVVRGYNMEQANRLKREAQEAESRRLTDDREAGLAVFSLRSLLETAPGTPDLPVTRTDSASLLTAVETALTMGGEGQKAEMKFHPETGVLVVRGTPGQTAAVGKLLGEVQGDLQRFRSGATNARLKEAELMADVRRAEVDVQGAKAEVEYSEQEVAQMQELARGGQMPATEIAKAQLALQQRRANVARAQIEMEKSAQALDAWRSGAGGGGGPMTPEKLREEIKRVERMLDTMRAELKKMEAGAR